MRDMVTIADVPRQIIFGDDFAHIAQDFFGSGDGRAAPGLEPIAEGMQVTIRTNAGIFMRPPGAAEAFLILKHNKALVWALGGEVIGRANAGNAGTNNQHIKIFDGKRIACAMERGGIGHASSLSLIANELLS